MLTRVQVPGAARDFCPRVNVQCRLSYGVCAAPMSKCTHQNLCACSNSQTLAATPLSGCMTILHTPTEWVALLLWLLRLTLGRWEVLGRKNRVPRGQKTPRTKQAQPDSRPERRHRQGTRCATGAAADNVGLFSHSGCCSKIWTVPSTESTASQDWKMHMATENGGIRAS